VGVSEKRVTITIDRLVLKGIPAEDRLAFASGLKAELARVLASPHLQTLREQSSDTPVIRLPELPMQRGLAGARGLGRQVGQSIGKRMKP
jgi:hypothetical protein